MSIELPAVLERLRHRLGSDAMIVDAGERGYYAQDLFARGAPLAAVLRPADAEVVCFAVGELCNAGIAVITRGGGMSYTECDQATDGSNGNDQSGSAAMMRCGFIRR
jgi:FAD/FMN-containing dehydrogenase